MSVLIGKGTRVVVQGVTGRDGSFHTRGMLEYGTKVVAGVTPGKGGEKVHSVPVFDSVEEAVYLGDRVFVMAAEPGRLVEVLKVPRPNEPPEESRRKPWFIDFCQGLLRRLEEESSAPPGVKV